MKLPLAPLLLSAALFLLLLAGLGLVAYVSLSGQSVAAAWGDLADEGRTLAYRYGWVDRLNEKEIRRLYQRSCTRRCHGREVIEKGPKTAAEWEGVVARMAAPDRAHLDERLAELILRYLQTRFLSNVPTVLPPATMRHVKQYLWRSDFGESDLFLDLIYVPREQTRLLRYLGVRNLPAVPARDAVFVVFVNTHSGRVPEWNLAQMAQLRTDGEPPRPALRWEVLYRDGQQHHNQGMLVFPAIDRAEAKEMEVTLRLGGLGTRVFLWRLPVPPLTD